MRRWLRSDNRQQRKGAAATEFALVLPLMILLTLGCVDFGRVAYHYIAVQNAARAGAAYAIMTPYLVKDKAAWEAAIQQQARNEMTNQVGYDASKLTTTVTSVIESTGLRRVKVIASYESFETLVSWPGIPSSVELRAGVNMRAIR